MNREELTEVYLATNYVVETPNGEIVLRVGERSKLLDKLLENHGAESWAFLTAYNPRSQELPDEENKARQENLLAALKNAGFDFLQGRGENPNDENWQPEPSIFIFDIKRETALEIARRFEQNAIVYGYKHEIAALLWCDKTNS